MYILLQKRAKPEGTPGEPPPGGTWIAAQKGNAAGEVEENSATSLTISARGGSDTTVDIDYAYQEVVSGDIQIIAEVPSSWSGYSENYTQFGVGISEGDEASDYFFHSFWAGIGRTILKYGTSGSVTSQQGQTGASLPRFVAVTYDDTAEELKAWESADGTDWFQIGDTVSRELTYPARAYVYGCSHNEFETSIATLTDCALSSTITISEAVGGEEPGPRKVNFAADFETGQIQDKDGLVDAFFIHTLPINQSGSTSISSGSGGFGPSSQTDTRVIQSRTPPSNGNGSASETVLPRKGSYFLETALYYDKDYTELNNGLEKPRQKMNVTGADGKFEFDTEVYIGFSVFIPSNYEVETTGARHGYFVVNTSASGTLLSLRTIGSGGLRWKFQYYTGLSVGETSSAENQVDLGPILDDRGMWTDFVIRYRANPFTSTTNASTLGGKNQTYEGNKGILQVWKTTGSVDENGDREFTRFINIVNAPVGLVPHPTLPIQMRLDSYKGNWQNASTSVEGPIWHAFDCFYQGEVIRDGTGFSDVNPSRLEMP